jgi:hypothetical protein
MNDQQAGLPGPDLGPWGAVLSIQDGRLVLDFLKELRWVSMTPAEALAFAANLERLASKLLKDTRP